MRPDTVTPAQIRAMFNRAYRHDPVVAGVLEQAATALEQAQVEVTRLREANRLLAERTEAAEKQAGAINHAMQRILDICNPLSSFWGDPIKAILTESERALVEMGALAEAASPVTPMTCEGIETVTLDERGHYRTAHCDHQRLYEESQREVDRLRAALDQVTAGRDKLEDELVEYRTSGDSLRDAFALVYKLKAELKELREALVQAPPHKPSCDRLLTQADERTARVTAERDALAARLGKVEAALRAIIADCAVGVGTARIIEVARDALKGPADAS